MFFEPQNSGHSTLNSNQLVLKKLPVKSALWLNALFISLVCGSFILLATLSELKIHVQFSKNTKERISFRSACTHFPIRGYNRGNTKTKINLNDYSNKKKIFFFLRKREDIDYCIALSVRAA